MGSKSLIYSSSELDEETLLDDQFMILTCPIELTFIIKNFNLTH